MKRFGGHIDVAIKRPHHLSSFFVAFPWIGGPRRAAYSRQRPALIPGSWWAQEVQHAASKKRTRYRLPTDRKRETLLLEQAMCESRDFCRGFDMFIRRQMW